MSVTNAVAIDIFSIAILAFLFSVSYQREEKAFLQHRLYLALLACIALMLTVDALSRGFDGLPGQADLFLNRASNLLLFVFTPLAPCIWVLFADYQVNRDGKRLKMFIIPMALTFLLNAAIAACSIHTGWYFTIGPGNVYRRGPWLLIHASYCYAIYFYAFLFILASRKRIERSHFLSLLLFSVPPAIGSVLQTLFYGMSLVWSGLTLSILMIYVNIQDKRLNTDYLTGIYNRRLLDSYVEDKVKNSVRGKTFSAILIDLDDFKRINDRFGHDVGDEALLDAAGLLKSCLRHGDLISRYGGDEFLIVLDISDSAVLEETVERIKNCFDRYNESGGKPYELRFSTGYAVYDMSCGMDPEQFIKHIDTLMYEDKARAAV